MRTRISLLLAVFLGLSMLPVRALTQTNPNSNTAPDSSASESDDPSWLFPVAKLDEVLPCWLHIGGEYRDRLEGPLGTGFAKTSDFYVLDRLRVKIRIEPKEWLTFFGEVQDARIFFNHHIPNANPFEDSWTLWQGYAQVGSSTSGWVDALAGRQVLLFGDERVIAPSNWLNVGRTFDVARIDIHHPGYEVAVFAASVVPGSNTFLHRAIPGNNLYGIYGSVHNIIPRATFEPYVLWRLAPGNFGLPETVGRGHLNEVTIGLHAKGSLPADLDYDTEFDGQTGSLGASSIGAWAGYAGLGKTFPKVVAAPRVFIEGNYASGTKNPAGRNWNTFDQLYPSNHDKFGFADQVGRRNLVQFRVGGFLADRFATRSLILAMVLLWSLCQLPIAATASIGTIMLCRAVLGLAQGPAWPVAVHALTKWFPNNRRNLPIAIVAQGSAVGLIAAGLLMPLITARWGWRANFVMLAVIGSAWALVWLAVSGEEAEDGADENAASSNLLAPSYARLLFDRSVLGCAITHFVGYWSLALTLTWLPAYFERGLGYDDIVSGRLYALVVALMIPLGIALAWGSERLLRKGIPSKMARGQYLSALLVVSGVLFAAVYVSPHVHWLSIGLIAVAIGCTPIVYSLGPAVLAEVVPAERRGAVLAINNSVASLAGIAAPVVGGIMIQGLPGAQGYELGFALSGALMVAGGLFGFWMIDPERSLRYAT